MVQKVKVVNVVASSIMKQNIIVHIATNHIPSSSSIDSRAPPVIELETRQGYMQVYRSTSLQG